MDATILFSCFGRRPQYYCSCYGQYHITIVVVVEGGHNIIVAVVERGQNTIVVIVAKGNNTIVTVTETTALL